MPADASEDAPLPPACLPRACHARIGLIDKTATRTCTQQIESRAVDQLSGIWGGSLCSQASTSGVVCVCVCECMESLDIVHNITKKSFVEAGMRWEVRGHEYRYAGSLRHERSGRLCVASVHEILHVDGKERWAGVVVELGNHFIRLRCSHKSATKTSLHLGAVALQNGLVKLTELISEVTLSGSCDCSAHLSYRVVKRRCHDCRSLRILANFGKIDTAQCFEKCRCRGQGRWLRCGGFWALLPALQRWLQRRERRSRQAHDREELLSVCGRTPLMLHLCMAWHFSVGSPSRLFFATLVVLCGLTHFSPKTAR